MNAFADIFRELDALEEPLSEAPAFFVEAPDGKRDITELARVGQFQKFLRRLAPEVKFEANANAGRRNPTQARKEGIVGGVFDYTIAWAPSRVAWVEFKGYSSSVNKATGRRTYRAGTLQQNQIDWGNARQRLGHDVACFFDPMNAIDWLRNLGCPIRGVA